MKLIAIQYIVFDGDQFDYVLSIIIGRKAQI